MKMMKWALLGGAAFAVMTTSAQADELSALKAQLESLQARVTQLEAQPAASMPSGYSLLSFRDGRCDCDVVPMAQRDRIGPDEGITISVVPTADVAPAAELSISGEVRTLLTYHNPDNDSNDDDTLDVEARGRLVVDGKADTAVGEVGAHFRLQGGDPFDKHVTGRERRNGDDSSSRDTIDVGVNSDFARMNQAYGWWKFAPNWQLIAGYWDTTAAIQAGIDWDFTLGATGGFSDKNTEQMRLVYTSGAFTAAIALEDTDDAFSSFVNGEDHCGDHHTFQDGDTCVLRSVQDRGDFPAVAGYLMYNNDNLMFQVAGVYQDDQFGDDNDWGVGAGARIGLGDMFTLTAGAVYAEGYNGYTDNLTVGEDDKWWGASGGVIFNIAEASRVEAGYGYEENQDSNQTVNVVNVGFYYDPVSQVTVGLQGDWVSNDPGGHDSDTTDDIRVRFGTWLRFKGP